MRDDTVANWKSALGDCVPGSVGVGVPADLSHSMTETLDTWPGWPPSLLTGPALDTRPHSTEGSDASARDGSNTSAAALDIEEFIPGKPWQGPTIRSADDDPFITPGESYQYE